MSWRGAIDAVFISEKLREENCAEVIPLDRVQRRVLECMMQNKGIGDVWDRSITSL